VVDRLPAPPERAPARIRLVREVVSLWRLHWEADALQLQHHPTGRYRFDAPAGEYPVLYGNKECLGAFAEVYGDTGLIDAAQGARLLSCVTARCPLRLVPLDDPLVLRRLGLDMRVNVSKDYGVTQQWSLAFHRWRPDADGVRYLSRHAAQHHNYCLFLDRCATDLSVNTLGAIQDLRRIVLFAADRYHLAVSLPRGQ